MIAKLNKYRARREEETAMPCPVQEETAMPCPYRFGEKCQISGKETALPCPAHGFGEKCQISGRETAVPFPHRLSKKM